MLGWSDHQVRSDLAIRRHWQLVCCTFTSCWWANGRLPTDEEVAETSNDGLADPAGRGKARLYWPETLRAVKGWLKPSIMLNRYWRAFCEKPRPPELRALLDWVFSAEGSTSRSTNNKLPISQVSYTLQAEMLVVGSIVLHDAFTAVRPGARWIGDPVCVFRPHWRVADECCAIACRQSDGP